MLYLSSVDIFAQLFHSICSIYYIGSCVLLRREREAEADAMRSPGRGQYIILMSTSCYHTPRGLLTAHEDEAFM